MANALPLGNGGVRRNAGNLGIFGDSDGSKILDEFHKEKLVKYTNENE